MPKNRHSCRHASNQIKDRVWWLRVDSPAARAGNPMPWSEVERSIGWTERQMRKWIRTRRTCGMHINKRWRAGHYKKLSLAAIGEMIKIITKDPDLYYDEVRDLVHLRMGEDVSVTTIAALCLDAGFRSKLGKICSVRRNKVTMKKHAVLRSKYHLRQFLFVDEAQRRGRDMIRKRVKARDGEDGFVDNSRHLASAWTVLAAMDRTGLVAQEIVELSCCPASGLPRAMDRARWMSIFKAKVLPHLRPCDYRKLKRSILVLDNCSLHWGTDADDDQDRFVNELERLVQQKGALLCYTPPYCPRANAIEPMFKAMNDFARRNRELTLRDPKEAMQAGLRAVPGPKAETFVRKSGKDVAKWLQYDA